MIQLPKILLPEQEDELKSRTANIDELITDEIAALVKEKEETTERVRNNRGRIEELSTKLSDLKSRVKPSDRDRRRNGNEDEVDELGRSRRRDSERDDRRDRNDRGERERSRDRGMDVDEEKEREAGRVQGEDGDVEVEY